MKRQDAIRRLRNLLTEDDPWRQRAEADRIVGELLVSLGYKDVVDAWEKVTTSVPLAMIRAAV